MTDSKQTVDDLLAFLKQAGMQGLINPAVARSRRNAIEQLQSELTASEREDMRQLDVDELASRFHKLEGSSIRSEALALYVDRFKMALADYARWNEEPSRFESIGGERPRAQQRGTDGRFAIGPDQQAEERIRLEACDNPSDVVQIALRHDCTVYLAGLPLDLSRREADKIARVVLAFAEGADRPEDAPNGPAEESKS
jgi:hypothetical protein